MPHIKNPILPGFNPDPSIVRVGDDYYIACSTFEWFPGVQIHHSTDLMHWQLIARPLDTPALLNLIGVDDSAGVWAPCLSHHDGVFYLVYTNMLSWRGIHKEALNYVVTAPSIHGPWSPPVFLNGSGFDPSFFHQGDKSYLVYMRWDFRYQVRPQGFDCIALKEFDRETRTLIGPEKSLLTTTELGSMEGPHLHHNHGYYYLVTAEGGTEYGHAVTIARSQDLFGPYTIDPDNPMLSSKDAPDLPIQKAGHGSFVETQTGEWYLAHLCGRPVTTNNGEHTKRCILGRETALQKCEWRDGWLRLTNGKSTPEKMVDAPDFISEEQALTTATEHDFYVQFTNSKLPMQFQSLRIPIEASWCYVHEKNAVLTMRGQGPLTSKHRQSLIGTRVLSHQCAATTCVSFAPENYHQMAGLTVFYDTSTHYYLCITHDEAHGGICLKLYKLDKHKLIHLPDACIPLKSTEAVHLKVEVHNDALGFSYALRAGQWQTIGPVCDSTILSDDYIALGFTGAFVGMACQDLYEHTKLATFEYFKYESLS